MDEREKRAEYARRRSQQNAQRRRRMARDQGERAAGQGEEDAISS